MKTKTYETPAGSDSFESKDYQNVKSVLSKFDYDLYDEEKKLVERVIRVKRVQMPNKGEKWKLIEDNKVIFTVDGAKISKKEKEYLRTADGLNFLITQYKDGIKSLNSLRKEMKKKIK